MPVETRFFKSSTFRLALLYMLLFTVSALLLLGFIYLSTAAYISAQTDNTIDIEIGDLTERYRSQGPASLVALMQSRLRRQPTNSSVYLLTDKDLNPLVGNLSSWPLNAKVHNGWLDFKIESLNQGHTATHRVRARVFRLNGGLKLLVGQDIHQLEQTKRQIITTLLWGLLITLVLGGLGSVMMGRNTLRRIEAINAASRGIMAGDLARRIPSRDTGDDFDLLAENLNRMIDQIAALMEDVRRVSDNIAHDLRTPLARLRNRLEELQRGPVRSHTDQIAIEKAVSEADQLLNTFNALLRIAQVESGEAQRKFKRTDISALLQDVVAFYEPLAQEKNQSMHVQIAPDISILADRDLMFQAAANLLDNAIKYTPGGGKLQVLLEPQNATAVLRITDNGPGIPEPARESVFQRFFRLEESRTTPGNGLGMSLVAAVIRLHHMHIQLADNRPGLQVIIRMPLHAEMKDQG